MLESFSNHVLEESVFWVISLSYEICRNARVHGNTSFGIFCGGWRYDGMVSLDQWFNIFL